MKNLIYMILLSNLLFAKSASIVFTSNMEDITNNENSFYSQFHTLVNEKRKKDASALVLFGGNSLGPSIMGSLDNGSHIVEILNNIKIDAMTVAKKDLSYGMDELSLRSFEASFPMTTANIKDISTKNNIEGINNSLIITKNDKKFGIISYAISYIKEIYSIGDINVLDIEKSIRKESKRLKKLGADIIILVPRYTPIMPNLVSKMIKENIINLAIFNDRNNVLEDSQLHPKHFILKNKNNALVLKLNWEKNDMSTLKIEEEKINLSTYKKNEGTENILNTHLNRLDFHLNREIGTFQGIADTRKKYLRQNENALGNLIADAIKDYTSADISIIQSGGIRSNKIYKNNTKVSYKDMLQLLPYRNIIILIEINGKDLKIALENGFSLIESIKGRYPQVSGLKIVYDSSFPKYQRLLSVHVNGKIVNDNQKYRLAIDDYLYSGGDGYSVFKNAKKLTYANPSNLLYVDIVSNYFQKLNNIEIKLSQRLVDKNEKHNK